MKKEKLDLNRLYYELIEKFKSRKSSMDLKFITDRAYFLLEKEENITIEKILAIVLIELQDYKEAKNILLNILEKCPDDPEALNAIAYIYLKEGLIDEATKFLLDALYIDKENKTIKNNLERIRNTDDPKIAFSLIPPKDFLYLNLPPLPFFRILKVFFIKLLMTSYGKFVVLFSSVVLLLIIIYLIYPSYINWAEDYRFKKGLGKGRITHLEIKDIEKLVEERKKYQLKLSEEDVKKKFSMIEYYLQEKKVNKATITINELLNSNASEQIKERVIIWRDFLIKLENSSQIDYLPSVQEVLRAPFLYQDVYVSWGGTIVNLEHKERKETVFDLLINFVDNATVEGIAEVHLEGFHKVSNSEKVYVFGQIYGINLDNHILVKGITIQKF
ncbi:MAG: tetratricopeptide repeat protein [Brevinematia bacterium]